MDSIIIYQWNEGVLHSVLPVCDTAENLEAHEFMPELRNSIPLDNVVSKSTPPGVASSVDDGFSRGGLSVPYPLFIGVEIVSLKCLESISLCTLHLLHCRYLGPPIV